MTLFIPEWGKVSGRGVHIKRVLNTLGEGCVVRRPVQPEQVLGWTPRFFVQQPGRQWAAVAVLDAPFASLDPHQLFSADEPDALERLLQSLQGLDAGAGVGKLVLLWACSPEEADALDRHHRPRHGVRLAGRETFLQHGAALLHEVLAPLDEAAEHALMGRFFPEAEIPVASTTRRFFRRDNSARLTRYFLDHDQEWASKLDLDLPAEQAQAAHDFSVRLINGVAGSGKTLIALSRALLLADLFPSQRVLVLIHNTPIVAELTLRVRRLGRRLPPNLEIQTFFGWAYRQWRRVFRRRPRLPEGPQAVEDLIRHHRMQWPGPASHGRAGAGRTGLHQRQPVRHRGRLPGRAAHRPWLAACGRRSGPRCGSCMRAWARRCARPGNCCGARCRATCAWRRARRNCRAITTSSSTRRSSLRRRGCNW